MAMRPGRESREWPAVGPIAGERHLPSSSRAVSAERSSGWYPCLVIGRYAQPSKWPDDEDCTREDWLRNRPSRGCLAEYGRFRRERSNRHRPAVLPGTAASRCRPPCGHRRRRAHRGQRPCRLVRRSLASQGCRWRSRLVSSLHQNSPLAWKTTISPRRGSRNRYVKPSATPRPLQAGIVGAMLSPRPPTTSRNSVSVSAADPATITTRIATGTSTRLRRGPRHLIASDHYAHVVNTNHRTSTTLVALEIDHVLIAVADLAAAAQEIETRYGLASIEGGRHPDWGTADRIVPLGQPASSWSRSSTKPRPRRARSVAGSLQRVRRARGRSAGPSARTISTTSPAGST